MIRLKFRLWIALLMVIQIAGPSVNIWGAKENSEFKDIILNESAVILVFSKIPAFTTSDTDKSLVVDLDGCVNMYEYKSINVKNGYVEKVSVSQYKLRPKPVVRVTFAMEAAYSCDLTQKDDALQFAFSAPNSAEKAKDDKEKQIHEIENAGIVPEEPVKSSKARSESDGREVKKKPEIKKDNRTLVEKMTIEPVSLDFNKADIRDVLRLLSAKSGINMIFGDDVSGSLTIHLENVPFREAFETILHLKGLVVQQVGESIIRVLEPQTLTEERAKAATFTKILALNYADAGEVKSNLDAVRAAEGRKGAIEIDARTNSLIVTDTPEGLVSVEKLIRELDSKPKQVLIEAKLVEVSANKETNLGISWEGAMGTVALDATGNYSGDNFLVGRSESVGGTDIKGVRDEDLLGRYTYGEWPSGPSSGGTGVSLPGPASVGFSFGYIKDDLALAARLSALVDKNDAKILSNPKITTINNKPAKIEIVDEVPYLNTTFSGDTPTSETVFATVGIILDVTPTINADNRVTLELNPEVSDVKDTSSAGPALIRRKASTTVLVKNGETLVIGGLVREKDEDTESKVPFFGDLPLLGYLFKSVGDTKERRELLIFIKPIILVE